MEREKLRDKKIERFKEGKKELERKERERETTNERKREI